MSREEGGWKASTQREEFGGHVGVERRRRECRIGAKLSGLHEEHRGDVAIAWRHRDAIHVGAEFEALLERNGSGQDVSGPHARMLGKTGRHESALEILAVKTGGRELSLAAHVCVR